MKITEELLAAARTEKGGYTKKQLEAIGVEWPPANGWWKELIGKEISDEQVAQFMKPVYVKDERPKKEVKPMTDDGIGRSKVCIYIMDKCDHSADQRGTYQVVMSTQGKEIEFADSFTDTTNYRVIIQAAIDAIKKLKCPCIIDLYTRTSFGFSKLREANGEWREVIQESPNEDLLMELKEVIVKGAHVVNVIIDKESIEERITPAKKKFFTVALTADKYREVNRKCKDKRISLSKLMNILIDQWLEEK